MSTETPTELDAESRALRAEAEARRANLEEGADVTPPKGDEPAPVKVDRDAARKAIFKKGGEQRAREMQELRTNNANVGELEAAMAAEQGHAPQPSPAPSPAPTPAPAPAAKTAGQDEPAFVTLPFQGRTISVARSDIERAGGQEMYLLSRSREELEARQAELDAQHEARQKQLDERLEQMRRLQEELQQQSAAGHEAPAHGDGGTPSRDRKDPSAASADKDLEREAQELTDQFFSGDPEDANKAILKILREARSSRQQFTAEEIADLAAKRLQMQRQPPEASQQAPAPAPAPDPRWERTREAINRMAEAEFPDLVKDTTKGPKAVEEFFRLARLPENRDRRLIDVARDAFFQIATDGDPRRQAREIKQGLPVAPSAGGRAQADSEEDAIPSNSDFVNLLRKQRGQTPM